MNGAFETVESVDFAVGVIRKRLIVLISTGFTDFRRDLLIKPLDQEIWRWRRCLESTELPPRL